MNLEPDGASRLNAAVLSSPGTHRRTRQRAAIAALLAQSAGFRSAQALHGLLRARGEKIGLATVYRILHALAGTGELDVIGGGQGETLYRRCATRRHHHHLVCRACGRTAEVTSPAVKRWIAQVAAEHGYRDIEHVLEVTGTCRACTRRAGTNAVLAGPSAPEHPLCAGNPGDDQGPGAGDGISGLA